MVEELKRLFEKYVLKIQDFKKMAQCKELVPLSELNGIISLCKLFDVLGTVKNGVSANLTNLLLNNCTVTRFSLSNFNIYDTMHE